MSNERYAKVSQQTLDVKKAWPYDQTNNCTNKFETTMVSSEQDDPDAVEVDVRCRECVCMYVSHKISMFRHLLDIRFSSTGCRTFSPLGPTMMDYWSPHWYCRFLQLFSPVGALRFTLGCLVSLGWVSLGWVSLGWACFRAYGAVGRACVGF